VKLLRNKAEGKSLRENLPVTTIEPSRRWFLPKLGILWEYRDLFYFLVWRETKIRYTQSIFGIGWALLSPIINMLIFTVIFGYIVKIKSEGVPYAVFCYTALVPWNYFNRATIGAGNSLIGTSSIFTKVYFPRVFIPLTPIISKFFDFIIAFLFLLGLLAWFRLTPSVWILSIPLYILIMFLFTSGLGMWFTALAVQYRDMQYLMPVAVQLLMYASPVIYPVSMIPLKFRLFYAINPMVGVIEGMRASILGTTAIPYDLIVISATSAVVFFVSGLVFFQYKERYFADIV